MADDNEALVNALNTIVERLDLLIAMNVPPVGSVADGLGETERAVFELCDMSNTAEEIAKKVGKTKHNVEVRLSSLRKKGLVVSVKAGERLVHARTRG